VERAALGLATPLSRETVLADLTNI